MKTYLLLGLAFAFFVLSWYFKRPDITPALARKLLAEGGVLVDVRSPSEFSAGHIDGVAKRTLRAAGFAQVYNLGSMGNW